nr:hypothetical protein [Extibacter muris]
MSIEELNYLASRLEDMADYELEVFEAVIESGEYSTSMKECAG